jgi:hypothetical protein
MAGISQKDFYAWTSVIAAEERREWLTPFEEENDDLIFFI